MVCHLVLRWSTLYLSAYVSVPINPDKAKRIPITVSLELAEKISVLAEKERRSVASWIRNAVEDRVAADWKD